MEVKLNIFYINSDPIIAAQQMVDRHVIKMILETAQLLSTAHRVLDGKMVVVPNENGRKMKRWVLSDDRETKLYVATHIHHPSAIWCRETSANYQWLYWHFVALLDEYTHRYGKIHKCDNMKVVLSELPKSIKHSGFTQPTPAMDEQYVVAGDSLASYMKYYKYGKKHLHTWTKRTPPEWITE